MKGEHADAVRDHVIARYITPARSSGRTEVQVRVGDVHSELSFKNKLPLVCAALGAAKFQQLANVTNLGSTCPQNSTTTTFTFRLD